MSSEPDRRSVVAVAALDFLINHRLVDIVGVALFTTAWVVFILPRIEVSESIATSIATGAATLAGLVIAATAFVCTMVYTSDNSSLKSARRKFGRTSSRNWRFILLAEFASALGSVASILAVEANPKLAVTITAVATALLTAAFLRTLVWLDATLLAEHQGSKKADKVRILRPPA